MKKILFAALVLTVLFTAACTKQNEQVLVRFQNATDSNIEESLMSSEDSILTDVGPISAGETTDYIVFDYFEVGYYPGGDSKHPRGSLIGKKDGVEFSAWSGNWCGTGVEYKQLEPGKYTLKIVELGSDAPWTYQINFVD